jgi:hypothetical protein
MYNPNNLLLLDFGDFKGNVSQEFLLQVFIVTTGVVLHRRQISCRCQQNRDCIFNKIYIDRGNNSG